VIEVLVKPADAVKVEPVADHGESDKASMEIPSSHAGIGGRDAGEARRRRSPRARWCCLLDTGAAVQAPAAAAAAGARRSRADTGPAPGPGAVPSPPTAVRAAVDRVRTEMPERPVATARKAA